MLYLFDAGFLFLAWMLIKHQMCHQLDAEENICTIFFVSCTVYRETSLYQSILWAALSNSGINLMSDGLSAISIETEIDHVRKMVSVPNFYVSDNHPTHQPVHILKKQNKKKLFTFPILVRQNLHALPGYL